MSQTRLLKQRKFLPLFCTQFFGAFNDNFLKNAMVILITYQAQTVMGLPASQIVVLAGGIFTLPFFLFSATAGQVAEKYDKAAIIRVVKWTEVAIMAVAAIGLINHYFSFLLFVLFMMGLHSTFFGPVKYSILPQHLAQEELVGGNALIEAGTFLAILLGTIAGSLVDTPRGTYVVSAGLLACALFGLATSYKIPLASPPAPDLKLHFNPIAPTREIFRFARQTRSVFLAILGISWFWFFGAAFLSLFPPICKDLFHGDSSLITTFLATFSVGIAIGSVLCGKISGEHLELGLVPFGSLGLSVFGGLFYFFSVRYTDPGVVVTARDFLSSPWGPWILGDLFLIAVFGGFFIVPLYALMQERSHIGQRSRIIAANNVLNALFMVVSSVMLVVMLHFQLTIPVIILGLAMMNLAVAFYIYFLMPEFMLRFLVCILAQLLYRVRVSGKKIIPPEGGVLLICNHVSFIDWLIIACGVYRPARFVMAKSYFQIPLLGPLFRQAKVIPIASAKEDPETLEAAFTQIRKELHDGQVVCIFPEGTITRDGDMGPFKPGILKMLKTNPVPVVPMAFSNLWGSLFSRRDKSLLDKRPRRIWAPIHLRIGPAIPPEEVTLEKLEEAVRSLRVTR
jgi:1-acyl-sn-glycerol-3-phosphate acyltransferase